MKRLFLTLFVCAIAVSSFGQRGFSYGNLQGVTRFGVNYQYQNNWDKSAAIDYITIGRNKNFTRWGLGYMEKTSATEQSTSVRGTLSFAKYLGKAGKRLYFRGFFGPEMGYEWKKSLMVDDKKNFFFIGGHVGFETEYFITKSIILYVGAEEYSHYYSSQLRLNWNTFGGIRFSFH